jgi:hypothetical protein
MLPYCCMVETVHENHTSAGDPEFPAFESARDELLPPREPELF